MKHRGRWFALVAFGILLAAASEPLAGEADSPPEAAKTEAGAVVPGKAPEAKWILKVEIVDKTAGQSLKKEHHDAIFEEIARRVKDMGGMIASGKEGETVFGTYRANIEAFTAGNRALRFWVGFGAGKANMRFTAEWFDGAGKELKESKPYQRFGIASMKSGEDIENQMVGLVGQYSQEFLASFLK